MLRAVRGRLRVFGAVFANPDLRRVEIAYAAFGLAEYGTWVAILVFAFEQGGATEVGLVAVIQLVPAALIAPFASVLGDRFRRDRVLFGAYLIQAVAFAATGAAMLLDAPVPVIYALAAAAATSLTITRPVQSALLPSLARSPEELTAANAATGTIESAMILAGPALGGLLLAVSEPGMVFATLAGGFLIGAVLVAGIRAQAVPEVGDREHPLREAIGGIRSVAREPRQRVVVGLVAAKSVIDGATDVLCVVVALALLGLDQSGAGYLTAALGAGGVIGGAVALGLVGRRRLAPALALGLVGFGIPVAFLGLTRGALVAGGLLMLSGVGFTVTDVAGRTLLQRVVPDRLMARVFGVLESLHQAALALGAILAPLFIELFGVERGIAVLGLLLPLVAVALWRPLQNADRTGRVPGPELALLRSIDMFAPLPPPTLEGLASRLVTVAVEPGTAVIREGETGDRFYVIAEGEVEVMRNGRRLAHMGPGGHFGEVALLSDAPRNATVVVTVPTRLVALERADFLEALTGHPQSREAADAVARARSTPEEQPLPD